MKNPKRVLGKILGKEADLAAFEASGESIELLVETLREVQKMRRLAQWLREHSGIEAALPPESFHKLLDLPEINFHETTDRNLDVQQHSLKDVRQPGDPVTVANLNTYLRELFRDLSSLSQSKTNDHGTLLLGPGISGDLVDRVNDYILRLRRLHWKGVGFLFTGFQARGIEKQFEALFPDARRAHPLRHHLKEVQWELGFYRRCLEINIRWAATGLDLFAVLRRDALHQTVENVGELGSGLWTVVYNGLQLKTTLPLAGIRLEDGHTLFNPESVPLHAA
ncbi:hypothetical protein [Nitrospina watsonii]|uniref:Uncharacterized protein n=1 Tax=Nitrospina watsonii TaxID=1323948 RepID=A0ABN8W247_9BACT|nr:hypothetical protein [Nitrospina watsonii]CAI2718996.1 conserved protein of unknown function [Nitrospina watsonii]